MMMPPKVLRDMLSNINAQLSLASANELTRGELLHFLGLMILMSKFKYQSRCSLWLSIACYCYIPVAKNENLNEPT